MSRGLKLQLVLPRLGLMVDLFLQVWTYRPLKKINQFSKYNFQKKNRDDEPFVIMISP